METVTPADWEPHRHCFMAWPGADLVSSRLITATKHDYAVVAQAISTFEPVVMLAKPGFGADAASYCGPGVEIVELPFRDAWLRDSGPIFVRRGETQVAVDFLFNGWGETVPAAAYGETVGAGLAGLLGLERVAVPLVLEGGAVTSDGEGTLVAVESTILNPKRNPGVSRAAFEAAFREQLGIDRTIWLEHGLLEDGTGGHVDNVAAFVGPGRVLCQVVRDTADPNHVRLEQNRHVLEAAGLEVVEVDVLPYRQWAGRRIALPYLNFYLGNGCVIVPLACLPEDRDGLARMRAVFTDREVVGVPATNLARRGGGAHCITLGQPAVGSETG